MQAREAKSRGHAPSFSRSISNYVHLTDLDQSGVIVLGTPLGHKQFAEAWTHKKIAEHEVLLSRMPGGARARTGRRAQQRRVERGVSLV